MTYSRAGDSTIIIDHTAVPDALRGRHVGVALVARAVEDARARTAGCSALPFRQGADRPPPRVARRPRGIGPDGLR